jgi:hypothetical protein
MQFATIKGLRIEKYTLQSQNWRESAKTNKTTRLITARRNTRLPVSAFHSHRCHVAALGRSCSGRPDVEDVVLPLEPAGSLTFQGYSAQRSPPGDHLSLCLASLNSNTRGSTFLV